MSAVQDFPIDDAGNPVGCEEDVLAARWAAMHQAADAIAKMLGQSWAGSERAMSLYPVGLPGGDLAELEEATGDLHAMMEQGLYAILRARENGAEAKVAAKTLLTRFENRRRALLSQEREQANLAA